MPLGIDFEKYISASGLFSLCYAYSRGCELSLPVPTAMLPAVRAKVDSYPSKTSCPNKHSLLSWSSLQW